MDERRKQQRLRTLLKETDERLIRLETIVSLLIDKELLDRTELEAQGLLSPPLTQIGRTASPR